MPIVSLAQFSLSGNVTSQDDGEALVGANVRIENTYYATVSDVNGDFQLNNLKEGDYTLKVTYIGYKDVSKDVKVTADMEVTFEMERQDYVADEITVSTTRAGNKTPVAHTNVNKEEIEVNNLGVDLPYLLDQTPSVVVTSDAGAGVGYTGIRIRGTDPTRINVTINGIPLNDAESQGSFTVNIPDFASSADNIQIQRGVGTSTNGAGAFGGTINFQTSQLKDKAYAETSHSYGSFNTRMHNIEVGSGLVADHFSFDGRLSRIASDGFMDRSSSDLKSYYWSAAYLSKKTSLRFINFRGKEITYQAWNGAPSDSLETNRTYNAYNYPNEVDNYMQDHYQLHFNQALSNALTLNVSGHFTHGEGFYEQYKGDAYNEDLNFGAKEALTDYGLDTIFTGSDTITETNLIRRRWLDNDFYGFIFSLNYDNGGKLKAALGGGWHNYVGRHFGEVIWAEYASNGDLGHVYYDNDAEKSDFNIYAKLNYQATRKLNLFLDLQSRMINYEFLGFDNNMNNVTQEDQLNFFNPKAGVFYDINSRNSLYASFAVANKEPNRNDYTESTPSSRPKQETLYDYELGYNLRGSKFQFGANLYYMDYKNQLVLTGQINDVGAYTRTNIDNSYRAGIELQAGVKPIKQLLINANLTFSQNKIKEFTEYVDNWDTGEQIALNYSNTDIAFSPSLIAGGEIRYSPLDRTKEGKGQELSVSFLPKYVGKQYIDNTMSNDRVLNAWLVSDLRLMYNLKGYFFKDMSVIFTLRNVFDEEYETNAWIYRYNTGDTFYKLDGYFPQAGRNFLVGVKLRF